MNLSRYNSVKLILVIFLSFVFYMSGKAQVQTEKLWYTDPFLWWGGAAFAIVLFIYILYKLLTPRKKKTIVPDHDVSGESNYSSSRNDITFDDLERERNNEK